MSNLPARVRIREVGPRDGFQNEPEVIPTAENLVVAFWQQIEAHLEGGAQLERIRLVESENNSVEISR